MAGRLKWNGPAFARFTEHQMIAGVDAARIELQRIARAKAGIPNPGVVVAQKRVSAGSNKTQRTIYPNSSKPGESPRRRTGVGQKNIVSGRRGLIGRVGYTRLAMYMIYHELGIWTGRRLERRPTIVPAIRENRRRLGQLMKQAAIAAGKGKGRSKGTR